MQLAIVAYAQRRFFIVFERSLNNLRNISFSSYHFFTEFRHSQSFLFMMRFLLCIHVEPSRCSDRHAYRPEIDAACRLPSAWRSHVHLTYHRCALVLCRCTGIGSIVVISEPAVACLCGVTANQCRFPADPRLCTWRSDFRRLKHRELTRTVRHDIWRSTRRHGEWLRR